MINFTEMINAILIILGLGKSTVVEGQDDDHHDKEVDDDHLQVEEEDCSGGAGDGGDAGENCSETETICDTVETEECYTKYEQKCEQVYKERCSTEYELECTTGEKYVIKPLVS